MPFVKGKSGNPLGRPKGAKGKRQALPAELTASALEQLHALVASGDVQSVLAVVDREYPRLKAVTSPESLDGQLLGAKLREISELESRLAALEALGER